MKEIKYIGFYCDMDHITNEERYNSPAANTKINYICETLNKIGYKVFFVSACETTGKKSHGKKIVDLDDINKLLLFRTFGRKNLIYLIIRKISIKMQMFLFLLFRVKKGEIVIAYHSLLTMHCLYFLRKIKKIKVIYEVEELYCDVNENFSKMKKKMEIKIINTFDGYIFPTVSIVEKLQIKKNYVICCGIYKAEKSEPILYKDDKIRIVYAGTLEKEKGGAINAINAMRFLGDRYVLYLLGTGTRTEIQDIKSRIQKINEEKGYEKIKFEGLLNGQLYIEFLQKCDIGLSTQSLNLRLNDTSFPSKILSYLSNGLNVISTDIPVVKNSPISNIISFCVSNKPEDIACSILNLKKTEYQEVKHRLCELDKQFQAELEKLLNLLNEVYLYGE